MTDLPKKSTKQEILERAAEVENEQRPYEYEVSGVEYDDLTPYFNVEDFGVNPTVRIPLLLKELADDGFLEQMYPSGSSANAAYRLSEAGWEVVGSTSADE